jgi:putative resolvase
MKANEVLNILRISRPTLSRYVKDGLILVNKNPSGRYSYDKDSVMKFLGKCYNRKTIIYARVSNRKQKNDLNNQIDILTNYCHKNGYRIDNIYKDIASGLSFYDRKDLLTIVDQVIQGKIEKIVITYKDRLSRIGFDFFKVLFEKFSCEIEVISGVGSDKLDSDEIFEEIVHLLNCYSMKLYSKRRKKIVKDLCNPII